MYSASSVAAFSRYLLVWSFASMASHMNPQRIVSSKCLAAHFAHMTSFAFVRIRMVFQIVLGRKFHATSLKRTEEMF